MIHDWRTTPVTDEMLLDVACAKCGQKRGAWCVYTPLKGAGQYDRSSAIQARVDLTGLSTKKCHNERYSRVRNNIRLEFYRETYPPIAQPSPDMMAALHGAQEFEARERAQLREWLCANATLLLHAGEIS